MKSKDLKKNHSAKKTWLGQTVNTDQRIQKSFMKGSHENKSVNEVLMQQKFERSGVEFEFFEANNNSSNVWDNLSKAEKNIETARLRAFVDPLTGLAKRACFEQSLDNQLIQAKRYGRSLAVLFIDIDKFRNINESYGNDIGDQVLLTVANRLKSFVRAGDLVSRWGGDEFVCLLLEVKQEADVARFAHQLVNRLAEPCVFNGTVLSITSNIGIAMYPADGDTADILFNNADIAMYKAKKTKKRVVVFRTEPSL
jgi:diguanylate cyclase